MMQPRRRTLLTISNKCVTVPVYKLGAQSKGPGMPAHSQNRALSLDSDPSATPVISTACALLKIHRLASCSKHKPCTLFTKQPGVYPQRANSRRNQSPSV